MAVAMDTYDVAIDKWHGGIHPMNKQIAAERLALAGLNVAYGFDKYPTRGPWPISMSFDGINHIHLIHY